VVQRGRIGEGGQRRTTGPCVLAGTDSVTLSTRNALRQVQFRRFPLPTEDDHDRGALITALWAVLPKHGRAAAESGIAVAACLVADRG
jgi:hypothetical protein